MLLDQNRIDGGSHVKKGLVLNSAIMSCVISLLRIANADIAMAGGSAGFPATPFQFQLDSIVAA